MLVSNGPKRWYQGTAEESEAPLAATMPGAPLMPAVAEVTGPWLEDSRCRPAS